MGSFKFQSTVKTIDIENSEGEVVHTFSLDVGNYDTIKGWRDKLQTLEEFKDEAGLKNAGEDKLKAALSEVVDVILGEGSFEIIWETAGGNVFACVAFTNYLASFVSEQAKAIQEAYV
ncbi:MAG: hypothetical protein PQJ60_10680 [Spirochaetales bacterium]|nr:hypothetical protein [Spirochaetales bacterium]